jgi:hypothetical protein
VQQAMGAMMKKEDEVQISFKKRTFFFVADAADLLLANFSV